MLQAWYLCMMRHGGYGRPTSILDLSYGSALLPSLPLCSKISLFHCLLLRPSYALFYAPTTTYLSVHFFLSIFLHSLYSRAVPVVFTATLFSPSALFGPSYLYIAATTDPFGDSLQLRRQNRKGAWQGQNCGSVRRNRLAGTKKQRC